MVHGFWKEPQGRHFARDNKSVKSRSHKTSGKSSYHLPQPVDAYRDSTRSEQKYFYDVSYDDVAQVAHSQYMTSQIPAYNPHLTETASWSYGDDSLLHTLTSIPVVDPKAPPRHMKKSSGDASRMSVQTRKNDTAEKSSNSHVARSSLIMGLGTLVSRILGLVRSPILLGALVGMTTYGSNAFDIANKLPNLIYMIVVGGLVNAVLVPAIVRATKESKDNGQAFINKLITIALVFLGSITLLLTFCAPWVVMLFSDMDQEWYQLTVAFAYWCIPQIFFYGLYTVFGQILNARENFGPYMWAPVANNIVAVVGFLFILFLYGPVTQENANNIEYWTSTRIALLGGISTLGIVVQALILIYPMRKMGLRYRPDFSWRNAGLSSAGKASLWVSLTMLFSLVPTAKLSQVASDAPMRAMKEGIDSVLVAGNYAHTTAFTIYSIPQSLIVVSIATAMFTRMAKAAADGNIPLLRLDTSRAIRTVSAFMFLFAALMIVLAGPISRILAFSVLPQEAVTLSHVLMAFCVGLVGVGVQTVLNRVYFAFEDTRGNFLVQFPFQIIQYIGLTMCFYLPPQYSVIGAALIQGCINVALPLVMFFDLRRRHMKRMDGKRIAKSYIKFFVAACMASVSGVAVLFLFDGNNIGGPLSFMGALLDMCFGSIMIVIVFLATMRALRMEEYDMFMQPVLKVMRKIGINVPL
ncbi:MAG: murein biosynthesis integral membrane protein MurJ [Actinomycetaceae bacterium]|nr:murein biosynthesis integral membrane protein MurJ [Actinomycetaceae bacterium]